MDALRWFRWEGTSLHLHLHIQPGARVNQLVALHGDRLKIKINAPPIDGRANETLIEFLAEQFHCNHSSVTVTKGAQGRLKTVCIAQPRQIPSAFAALGLQRPD